jgi:hypothetical protein
MGDKRDETIQYSKAYKRVVANWRAETQKELFKDLEPFAKQIEDLDANINPTPDDKKQIYNTQKQIRNITEKRIKLNSRELARDLGKLKRSDVEDDDKHKKILDELSDDMDKGIELDMPDAIADRYKFTKNLKLTVDPEDPQVGALQRISGPGGWRLQIQTHFERAVVHAFELPCDRVRHACLWLQM